MGYYIYQFISYCENIYIKARHSDCIHADQISKVQSTNKPADKLPHTNTKSSVVPNVRYILSKTQYSIIKWRQNGKINWLLMLFHVFIWKYLQFYVFCSLNSLFFHLNSCYWLFYMHKVNV